MREVRRYPDLSPCKLRAIRTPQGPVTSIFHADASMFFPPRERQEVSPHISQVSRCAGWVRAGGWFRTWPARVPAAVGGWAGSTMVSLVAGLVESCSQAAAALRNRA